MVYLEQKSGGAVTRTLEIGNGQHNLVLLLVDDLSASRPRLEGIWLLITLPGDARLTLVPVNPLQENIPLQLDEAFETTADNHPSPEFLDSIGELFLWDAYLVVDQMGISSVITAIGAADIGLDQLDEKSAASMPLSIDQQTSYWQQVCDRLSTIKTGEDIKYLYQQVASNSITNLFWDRLPLNPWQETPEGVVLGCEFPTINAISP